MIPSEGIDDLLLDHFVEGNEEEMEEIVEIILKTYGSLPIEELTCKQETSEIITSKDNEFMSELECYLNEEGYYLEILEECI